jgi:imidazolonepropionase-like amidohydrolase
MQRELELLVGAGISPLDVIRIATYNSAVFLGKADQLGSVDAGKLVDESQLPLAGGKQKRRFTAG